MADFSGFNSSIFQDDEPSKKPEAAGTEEPKIIEPEAGPDFSGLSFKALEQEAPMAELAPVLPDNAPATPSMVGTDLEFGSSIDNMSVFDTDEQDTMDFIRDRGFDIFQAGLVGGVGAAEAEIGRRIGSDFFRNLPEEDDSWWESVDKSLSNMSPISTLITIFTGTSGGGLEAGLEMEKEGAAVRSEAKADMQEIAKEADSTGKQIAMDVISSAAATAPAIATAPLGVPLLTLTGMGMTSYFDTTQEAFEKTGDIALARRAGFVDGVVEAGTEKLPLETLLKLGQGKNWFKDAIKFLIQEEGSELAATALQDLNAKLTYNPDMTWEEAADNLARTAISTPFSAGLQATAMRGIKGTADTLQTQVDKAMNKVLDKHRTPKSTGFTEEVLQTGQKAEEARQRVEAIQAEINGIMEEIQNEEPSLNQVMPTKEAREGMPVFTWAFNNPGNANSPEQSFNYIKQSEMKPVRQGKEIAPEDIKPGEVVLTKTTPVAQVALENIRIWERMRDEAKAAAADPNDPTGPSSVAVVEAALERARERAREAMKEQRYIESKRNNFQKAVQDWVKKYAPDMKILIEFGSGPIKRGSAIPARDDGVSVLQVNMDLARESSQRKGKKRRNLVADPGAQIIETLTHEFGHLLAIREFNKQPIELQDAVRNDWTKFVNAWASEDFNQIAPDIQRTHTEMFQDFQRKGQNSPNNMFGPNAGEQQKQFFKEYFPSFAEFLAHRMARAESYGETTQKYFASARKTLNNYWNSLPKSQRFDKNFERFLAKLAAESRLTDAKAQYEARVRRYRAALDGMRRAATTPLTDAIAGGAGTVLPPTTGDHWDGRDGHSRRVNASMDKFNFLANWTAGLTHMSDMNNHIPGVSGYGNHAQQLWQDKMRWTSKASEVLNAWAGTEFAKNVEERQRLSDFLFEADKRSEELGRQLSMDEMAELREEFGVSNSMYELAEKIWNTFREALSEVEDAVVQDLQNQLTEGNPQELAETLSKVRRDFAALRNRNYMPHSRFGTYTVTGYAQQNMVFDDAEYKQGQTVFFGSYATEADALKARKQLQREYGSGVRFGIGMIEDTTRELIDLPPALAELLENKLQLTAKQQKELADLRATLAPGQSFRKRFVQRDGIAGFSQDSLRVFADYMQKFAGHLARIKHVPMLEAAIQQMKDSARGIRQQGGNSVKREKIIGWYEKHLEYLINPGNELAQYRAIGFLWYLGFNAKSALVNATQVPLITYPYLAQEYNDVSAAAAISAAMYQVTKAQFTERGMDADAARMVDELIERGIIDESLATELAALAEGGFLARAPGKIGQKMGLDKPENVLKVQKFFEYGALMFQAMEKMNRRITAVAAYNLARKSGASHEEAVNKAHKSIVQTQYEYARFNRPRMMRGALGSNVFMFWQYVTNTLWFMGQNKQAAARYMVIMLLLGGVEGLPFASNILDLTDFAIKKLKEATGWSDPKKGARAYLWEAGRLLSDDPMMGQVMNEHTLMNGYSSQIFGMYDLSGSLQMGRILPGTEYLATDMNPNTEIVGGLAQMAGATVNIPLAVASAVFSDEPDWWKRVEKGLPAAAKSVSQGTRYAVRGEETDSRQAQVAEFDWPTDVQSWAEILGRASGMQLTRVSEERARRFASYDAIQYYSKRHTSLTKMAEYAYSTGDDQKWDEALLRIQRFNEQVPFPEMAIQLPSLVQSIKSRVKSRTLREMGLTDQMKYIRLQQDVEGRMGGEE